MNPRKTLLLKIFAWGHLDSISNIWLGLRRSSHPLILSFSLSEEMHSGQVELSA